MINIKIFTFNAFQENTYILYDDSKECLIVDPGCHAPYERKQLTQFITENALKPVLLLNTHCHIDHVMGNKFVSEQYDIALCAHEGEIPLLKSIPQQSAMFGIACDPSPMPERLLKEGDVILFGDSMLKTLFTPGHSPASVSFFSDENQFIIAGDVLFHGSIGRTDLPGGNYKTLIHSIKTKLMPLGDEVKVYSGHGGMTTIGFERYNNPFLQ